MLSRLIAAFLLLAICGCGSTLTNKPSEGRTVLQFPAGTFILTETFRLEKSHTVIQGVGPKTVFIFKPAATDRHCFNDRAFTTPCNDDFALRRRILGPIAIGDTSFTSPADLSDLQPGDWLIVFEKDSGAGNEIVVFDWAQVATVAGSTVKVTTPFRTAFPDARPWDPLNSGLGFHKLPHLVEGIEFRNFKLIVPDLGTNIGGISVFAAKDTIIDGVTVEDANGQGLYSYLSKGLTVTNSSGDAGTVLNEFAATVDLELSKNVFTSSGDVGLGLDFGTAFFDVRDNAIPKSFNGCLYLLSGVHDGAFEHNQCWYVPSSGDATGILARGTQRVAIQNNNLVGGAGRSTGISIGPQFGLATAIPSIGNRIWPNTFGQWSVNYDPANQP